MEFSINSLNLSYHSRDIESVKRLIENGFDIHTENELMLRIAVGKGRVEIVKFLLEHGADARVNSSTLASACYFRETAIVKLLLEYGADVHANNDEALKMTCFAGMNNTVEIVKLLLEYGANVHSMNQSFLSTITDPSVRKLLTEYGANFSQC
jgi:ankyrin repeat protein